MRLLFAVGFLRGMKGAVEDCNVSLGVGPSIVWTTGREKGLHSFEVIPVHRLAIEVPSPKLDAHG